MKITIMVTEKKLTLSYLKQMPGTTYETMGECEVLGYITANVWKATDMLALCHFEGEYYLLNMLWKLHLGDGTEDPYLYHRNIRNRHKRKWYMEKEIIEDWFKKHERICKIAREKGHIYV